MKYTNKLKLPESIAKAVQNDPYTMGDADISVTGLIGPARQRRLAIDHNDEIVEDVADRIWSLYGQIVHDILERADMGDARIITEHRLFIERMGWTVSGQFDRLVMSYKTTLQDYKFTSLYSVKDGVKPEYEAQANIYKLMLSVHGYQINKLQIVAILRDWSKGRSKVMADYPDTPVVIQDVPVWPRDKTETYIEERIAAHKLAEEALPLCTPNERWASPTVYKVYKKGNKTASKGHAKHETKAGAIAGALVLTESTGKEHEVKEIPDVSRRCEDYCSVSKFCTQWHDINPNKLGL